MSDKLKKSNTTKPVIEHKNGVVERVNVYDTVKNLGRKTTRAGEIEGAGPNTAVQSWASGGRESTKASLARDFTRANIKAKSGPVKQGFSDEAKKKMEEEIARRNAAKIGLTPTKKTEDEVVDEEVDGKRELVPGKESLKKRWKHLKKSLHHDAAFMDIEKEMEDDDEPQQSGQDQEQQPPEAGQPPAGDQQEQPQQDDQPPPEDGQQEQPEGNGGEDQSPQEDPQEADQGDGAPLEAVSAAPEDDQQGPDSGNGGQPDPQELIDALKEEGYSDKEIAYIVHGHHAAEIDPSKQAKASATAAMSGIDVDSAKQMAELEREYEKRNRDHELEHSKRMADLEYQQAQKKQNMSDVDESHRKRMLDLEYEMAQKQKMMEMDNSMQQAKAKIPDTESDKALKREMAQLEIQKKKLDLKLHEEEMKLELEFKKREQEVKLKLMEQQLKEQARQKSEISGVRHEQRLADAANPPDPEEKPAPAKKVKKSEISDD